MTKIAYTREMYVLKCWAARGIPVKTSPPINGSTNYQTENQKFGTLIKDLKEDTQYTCSVEASNSVGSTVSPNHVAFTTPRVTTAQKFGTRKSIQITGKYYSHCEHPPSHNLYLI